MDSRSLQVRACGVCTSSSLSVDINEAWRILSHVSGSLDKHWFFITCTKHTHELSRYPCRLHDGSEISADCWEQLIGKLPVCVAVGSNLAITQEGGRSARSGPRTFKLKQGRSLNGRCPRRWWVTTVVCMDSTVTQRDWETAGEAPFMSVLKTLWLQWDAGWPDTCTHDECFVSLMHVSLLNYC